jgi:hypothetical protein
MGIMGKSERFGASAANSELSPIPRRGHGDENGIDSVTTNLSSLSANAKSKRLLRRLSAVGSPASKSTPGNPDYAVEESFAVNNVESDKIAGSQSLSFEDRLLLRNDIEECVANATLRFQEKINELELRLEATVGPVERILNSTEALTPTKVNNGVVLEEFNDRGASDSKSSATTPAVVNEGGDMAPQIVPQNAEISRQEDLTLALRRITALEAEIANIKDALNRKLTQTSLMPRLDPPIPISPSDPESANVEVEVDVDLRTEATPNNSNSRFNNYANSQRLLFPASDRRPAAESFSYGIRGTGDRNARSVEPGPALEPRANLSRALGSFLEVVQKCTGANEKTQDILSALDRNFYVSSHPMNSPQRLNSEELHIAGIPGHSNVFRAEDHTARSSNGSVYSSRSRTPQSRNGSPTSRVEGSGGPPRTSPLSSKEDVLSHRHTSKTFSFSHTPTQRGAGTPAASTGIRSPRNETWKEVYTPADLSARIGLASGSRDTSPNSHPRISPRQLLADPADARVCERPVICLVFNRCLP